MAEHITPGGSGHPPDQENKLIIDSDWKAEAQAEKEKLAKQEADAPTKGDPDALPEPDFRTVVSMLATQALMYLGAFPDETGRAVVVPEYAKMHIDLLDILQIKTRGNLDKDEQEELDQVLIELRQRFVQIMGVAQAQQAQQQPASTD
jgi:hypothetical protein